MSPRPPAFAEGLAELRSDFMLRALAERDSLEPSRALDRAVLARARAGAQAARETSGADSRHRARTAAALRWGVPAALATAAACAVVMQRMASHSSVPATDQPVFELMQVAPLGAVEMVSVSARRRGAGSAKSASAPSAYIAAHGSSTVSRRPTAALIETSALGSVRFTQQLPPELENLVTVSSSIPPTRPSPSRPVSAARRGANPASR